VVIPNGVLSMIYRGYLNCLLAREILPQMFKIVDPILEISTHSEQRIDTEFRLLFPLYFVLCLFRLPAN